jgi:1,4-dihydroxy-2-naphthoyl-CoA synthase
MYGAVKAGSLVAIDLAHRLEVLEHRPAAKNAITPDMHEELCRVWADFRDNADADIAIVTGNRRRVLRGRRPRDLRAAQCSVPSVVEYGPVSYCQLS